MDDPPQPSLSELPSTSSVPQIRSRITVVCAECKRLKLKCDRRTPCGSCTKRGTVPRCIYSPAAAEKVDLHSLNNRLIQVETILAMVTAGQTPPPFQSTYPLAHAPLPAPNSTPKLKTSRATPPLMSSISIRFNDLKKIWLLGLYRSGDEMGQSDSASGSNVKLEPFSGDNLLLTNPVSPAPSTHFNLPPLNVYYSYSPLPSTHTSTGTLQSQQAMSSLYRHSFRGPQASSSPSHELPPSTHTPSLFPPSSTSRRKPIASAALFALLPPPSTRAKLLSCAREVHPHLPLITPWSRVTDMADPSIKEEKARKKALANSIFFNSYSTDMQVPPTPTATPGPLPPRDGLLQFISLCYILALGALERVGGTPIPADPAFLHALAGQAFSVWEEYRTSAINGGEREEGKDGDRNDEGRDMKDEMDYLVACLLQVKYLIRAGPSTVAGQGTLEAVFPLIGKLVNLARGLGLAQDPDQNVGTGPDRNTKNEERKRLIWWDIMFYDTFISDALNYPASVSLFSYSTNLPSVAKSSMPSKSLRRKGRVDSGGGDFSSEDGELDDNMDKEIWTSSRGKSTAKRESPLIIPASLNRKDKGRHSAPSKVEDENHGFFGVRCRLTRLVQVIKHRLYHPGCECCTCGNGSGYTLDQAVSLEGEIRTWVAQLPSSLKLDPSSNLKSDTPKSMKHAVLAAEFVIMANRMIISVYLPLMRPPSDSSESDLTLARTYVTHPWSPASRATVDAAQCVVRAARVLHRLLFVPGLGNGSTMILKEYYSLNKAVLDATVICAHAAFGNDPIKGPEQGKAVLEEVIVGLEVLSALGETTKGELGDIAETLRRKLEGQGLLHLSDGVKYNGDENVLKRKHSQVEIQASQDKSMFVGLEALSFDFDHLSNEKDSAGTTTTPESPSIPVQQQPLRLLSRPSVQQRNVANPPTKVILEKENEKKKKGRVAYPTIGIRDRGKDGPPWMKKMGTPAPRSNLNTVPEPRIDEATHLPSVPTASIPQTPARDVETSYETTISAEPESVRNVAAHVLLPNDSLHSRSSSSTLQGSLAQPPQSVAYAMAYDGVDQNNFDIHVHQRRRLSHDLSQRPQQETYQDQQPFGVSHPAQYHAGQLPSHTGTFDRPSSYDRSGNSFDQNTMNIDSLHDAAPSPYLTPSTSSLSTASSPYGSGGGPPQTPNYDNGSALTSHHPSPPTFASQPVTTQTFHHIRREYDASFDNLGQHQQSIVMGEVPMNVSTGTPIHNDHRGSIAATPTITSTPIYEKQQCVLYDTKPIELDQRMQHQMHYQVPSDFADLSNSHQHQHRISIDASAERAWASNSQYLQAQTILDQNNPQYWTEGGYYQ